MSKQISIKADKICLNYPVLVAAFQAVADISRYAAVILFGELCIHGRGRGGYEDQFVGLRLCMASAEI